MHSAKPHILLSALLSGFVDYQGPDLTIHGLCVDSRQAKPGDLFIASIGVQQDGRLFIAHAIDQGVVAIVYESQDVMPQMQQVIDRFKTNLPLIPMKDLDAKIGPIAAKFYDFPAANMHVSGVTGTNGKTSCAYFLTQALSLLGKSAAMMGTIGNGKLEQLKESTHTTLCALPLQEYLYQFKQEKIDYVTMEVSSHALHQHRVAGVPFEIALFTNLTLDHLDYHQTMQAYGESKTRLFLWDSLQYAVINLDDDFADGLIKLIRENVKIIGVSLQGKMHDRADMLIHAQQIDISGNGTSAVIIVQNPPELRSAPFTKGAFTTAILGGFNLSNLLLVLGALLALDIPFAQALTVLAQLHEPPGRLTKIGGQGKPCVFIDYAHTPDALEKVLAVLKPLCSGKLWCVFGCGGDRDHSKRPIMASIAQRYADEVILTDDNPRSEDPAQIVAQIMPGFVKPEQVVIEHNRTRAIEYAILHAKVSDFILIAGKGHEDYQIIGTQKYTLSDLKIATDALQNLV